MSRVTATGSGDGGEDRAADEHAGHVQRVAPDVAVAEARDRVDQALHADAAEQAHACADDAEQNMDHNDETMAIWSKYLEATGKSSTEYVAEDN